ncbi:folliculin-interacting protein 1-like [Actinia tenebrosa]|uniref:Folliculin-interacting protein 1-like n=1 Tax=Actinia tenebrosa TaxID=6105 RepID=A0A6P8J3Z7_ACTTE|nr:folliculin-interacting protein 1-like [Actinia tenebrosa]
MLSKIFSFNTRKTGEKILESDVGTELPLTSGGIFPDLDATQIRILVFKDCDRKGKTLLYDSKIAKQIQEERTQDAAQGKQQDKTNSKAATRKPDHNHGSYSTPPVKKKLHRRSSSDSTLLGEMIFGSVAMTYKGSTVKVHLIRSPHQLLMTKVFSLRPRMSVSSNCSDNTDSFMSSASQIDSILEDGSRIESDCVSLSSQSNSPKDSHLVQENSSTPVPVPQLTPTVNIEPEDDSGFTASLDSLCCHGSVTSLFTPASSPCGSFQRRLHRSQITSIDSRFNKKQEESSEEPNSPILRRRPKIGIGILFPLSDSDEQSSALQRFFFAHFPLFNSHVHRLRLAVERACHSRNSFAMQVTEAFNRFCEEISNFLKTPRLKQPVWLNMMTFPDHRGDLCEKFMEQLTGCLNLYNNRETNFFLTAVLSAVLTHHLAWVPTVMPAGAAPSRAYLDKHSSKTLDLLAQSHPYNPLWAQLSDLYGAIGYPLKLARTVVVGKNAKLVGQVLQILSYFIRCTEVFEHTPERVDLPEHDFSHSDFTEVENCCLCRQNEDEPCHKHSICNPCIEKSGLSICSNCQKLIPKELDENISLQSSQLSRTLLQGLPCCSDCGLLQRNENIEEIFRVNSMSGTCGTCLPKWTSAKGLQHFLDDLSYLERSETFKCYCCEKKEKTEESTSTFKCYCTGDSRCSLCSTTKNGLNTNLQKSIELDIIFLQLLLHDQFCSKLECKCFTPKDNTSCLEMDLEQDSSEQNDVESNDSSARSGSLDSGFHPGTPSCSTKSKMELEEYLSLDTLEDEDEFGPEELPLPGLVDGSSKDGDHRKPDEWRKSNNFGRSLFAGVGETYHPDFVLQGVTCNKQEILPSLSNDLCMALQHSVVDDALNDAVCIVADTDNWTCELISAKKGKLRSSESTQVQTIDGSNLVLTMLTSVSGMWDVKMPAEFCLMHLEDRLKEIYLKSRVIAEWLWNRKKSISQYELAHTLEIDDSDIVLLLAVASAHSPQGITYIR